MRTRVVLVAGGTGGTKLAHGFAMLAPRVDTTVIANVGDDTELHGLHVSPDVDALLYTLGGLLDTERGWGVRDDTYTALHMLERYGAETWFTLGDADIATHVERSRRLHEGQSLTDAVGAMATALGITARILPASDDPYRTRILIDDRELDFQEYFVRLRQEPEVRGVRFEGADAALPTRAVLDALAAADLVVLGPSNPIVSIGPVLELPGMRDAVRAGGGPVVAVSPIIGGQALKGPADRMLISLGHESTALGVARLYAGLVDRFVLDDTDAGLAAQVAELGMEVDVLPTVMRTDADRRALAEAILERCVQPR